MPKHTDVAIIGAGQAGLAMSRSLHEAGIDHLVLERGRIGERWRSQRWPSLRLLTPNWMTRLPHMEAVVDDPDGFMPASGFTGLLERYAAESSAPVLEGCDVYGLRFTGGGFEIVTSTGGVRAASVVIASGACDRAKVPAWGRSLSSDILQVTTDRYTGPQELTSGGVLVVGASATGAQLAREIQASGRPVTLAVGRHVRTPRRYRGRDIYAWMDASGFLDDAPGDVPASRLQSQPSFQLVGDPQGRSLDLSGLASEGVQIVSRASDGAGHRVRLQDDLDQQCAAAEARRRKVLSRIDAFIERTAPDTPQEPEAWASPTALAEAPAELDLAAAGVRTIVWATGYRRSYPWLHVPVLDDNGEIQHRGGVTSIPGLYVLGMPFMRRRASALIDGVGRDVAELTPLIAHRLSARLRTAA